MNRMYNRGLRPGDQGARQACIGAEANRKGRINATAEDQYEELPPAEIEEHVLIQTLQAEDPTAQQRLSYTRSRVLQVAVSMHAGGCSPSYHHTAHSDTRHF